MGWRKRVDATHRPIADTFLELGWQVQDVHTCRDFCDLVVWKPGDPSVILVECKTVKSGTGRVNSTSSQKNLASRGCPIVTLTSADDVITFNPAESIRRRNA